MRTHLNFILKNLQIDYADLSNGKTRVSANHGNKIRNYRSIKNYCDVIEHRILLCFLNWIMQKINEFYQYINKKMYAWKLFPYKILFFACQVPLM